MIETNQIVGSDDLQAGTRGYGGFRVELFGALRAFGSNGVALTLPGGIAADVFAWLILLKYRTITREQVMEQFWPDEDAHTAQRRLRQSLWVIRQSLSLNAGPGALILRSDRSTVGFIADRVVTDVEEFDCATVSASHGEPLDQAGNLKRAVELYKGELLPGCYHDCFMAERDRLARQYRHVLFRLADMHSQFGELDEAILMAQQYVAADNLDEMGHCLLMRLLAAVGRGADVRRQYELWAAILKKETGSAPAAATRKLMEDLTREGTERLNQQVVALQLSGPSAQPFVHLATTGSVHTNPLPPSHLSNNSRLNPRSRRRIVGFVLSLAIVFLLTEMTLWSRRPIIRQPETLRIVTTSTYEAGPGETGNSEPIGLAPDGMGGAYLCGLADTATEDVNMVIQRYSSQGKVLWSRTYGSPEGDCDIAYSVARTRGGVFVAGETYIPPDKGVHGGWHHVLLRYKDDGTLLWTRRHPLLRSERSERAIFTMADGEGGALLSGNVEDSSGTAGMIARYDGVGKPLWTRSIIPKGAARAQLVNIGGWGPNIYVGGTAYRSATDDMEAFGFVCCLGRDGTIRWTRTTGDASHPQNLAHITVDSFGSVFAVGASFTGDPHSGGGHILTISRYLTNGVRAWTVGSPEAGRDVVAFDAACDDEGHLFVTGEALGPGSGPQAVTVCFDALGNQKWIQRVEREKKFLTAGFRLVPLKESVFVGAWRYTDHGPGRLANSVFLLEYGPDGSQLSRTVYGTKIHESNRLKAILPVPGGLMIASQLLKELHPKNIAMISVSMALRRTDISESPARRK